MRVPSGNSIYGGFVFGVIHIFYLVIGKNGKAEAVQGTAHTMLARLLIWITALLTLPELAFLGWVVYLLLPIRQG